MDKAKIIELLATFIAQRPGFEFANYCDVSAYRSDYNRTLQHKHDAERMLRFVEIRDSIKVADIEKQLAGGNRLSLENGKLQYVTGQYFPTEYRGAACRILVSVIWQYFRECGYDTGDKIRNQAKREFGKSIASRWFN